MDAIDRANKKFAQEARRQAYSVYGRAVLVLWMSGWGKERIARLLKAVQVAWNDNANDINTSAVKMLDDETGIELKADPGGKSYKELEYLNGKVKPHKMTPAEIIYMRGRQIKWLRAQTMALLFLALHRQFGFGYDRLVRVMQSMEMIAVNDSENSIRDLVLDKTEINLKDFMG